MSNREPPAPDGMSGAGQTRTAPIGEIAALCAIGLSLLVLAIFWTSRLKNPPETAASAATKRNAGTAATGGYVGSKSCGECHPGEAASFQGSGHARTLRPARKAPIADWLASKTFDDPEYAGVQWTYELGENTLSIIRSEGGSRERFEADFAIGSGRHALTFLSLIDAEPGRPRGLEHRLTYFAHSQTMGLTPGQSASIDAARQGNSASGFHLPPNVAMDCINCHATRISAAGPPIVDRSELVANVSCERCHGPAESHVAAARSGLKDSLLKMPFGPERESNRDQVRMCGACHRLPEMVPPNSIRANNPAIVRFPSVGLLQAKCNTRTPGGLSCTTCHDPHARASADAPRYESICLSCHQRPPEQKRCPTSPNDGCVGCHMPKSDVGHGLSFSDHWIRIRPMR